MNMGYSVRYEILPLDPEQFEGDDLEKLQQECFEDDLIENADEYGCSYLAFKTQAIPLTDEEVVYLLFQASGKIVASGLLIDIDMYDEVDEDGFVGEYVFIGSSIATFDPVSLAEFQAIDPSVKAFGNGLGSFDGAKLPALVEFLAPRLHNIDAEEFTPQEWIAQQLEAMAEQDEEEKA
jgi:hypothetical protein